jgi:S-adenosylmethionine-diacylglycerol 3-amino-3-carboxypropyl transferase
VVTVASGGCSALALAKAFPAVPITAFDMSPVQIAHAQAKLALALAGNEHALGVANDDAAGHSQCGEFEGLFRVLRLFLQEFVAPAASFQTFFAASTTPEARALLLSQWQGSPYFNAAFELAFADSLLLAMFGPAATQHAVKGSYPGYFRRAFVRGLGQRDAAENPFLTHVFLGRYTETAKPDYLGLASLSNIFDWSDDALVSHWAARLAALPSGATVLIRVLNNARDIRPMFAQHFAFDDARARELLAMDRSLFYERVLVGVRHP